MELHIDIPWLLERQAELLPEQPAVNDYSALVAAVARHRVNTPRLGEEPDAAWRAAALLHTTVLLKPLPARNELFGAGLATAYMHASEEGIAPPYGALIDLVRAIRTTGLDVYGTAHLLRSWRI
ncbi:hypothetical protein [Phaeacidiphilus oryzae]|uniref:hypothetical protein n=1 Tax=Phaeacidiphilus oryzae TaxID=348818 RepID=UPI00055FCCF1|nr:hypothetical protein [Phaeacidiphilus oryzae]